MQRSEAKKGQLSATGGELPRSCEYDFSRIGAEVSRQDFFPKTMTEAMEMVKFWKSQKMPLLHTCSDIAALVAIALQDWFPWVKTMVGEVIEL